MQEIEYLWVVKRSPCGKELLVCDWNDEPRPLSTYGLHVTPDLDLGRPVFRLLPNGYVGQYFRFEKIREAA